ncbi:MAG TPA: alpha/beta hydrolase [Anaerolineaceae bacterium]|nr:alpha/beta hydrolase [Anaerolineaceae bacterium]
MGIVAYLLSFLTLFLNISLFVKLKPPYSFYFVLPQLFAAALAPFLAILGVAGAVMGSLFNAPLAIVAGIVGAVISIIYIVLVTVPQRGFVEAFGKDWESKISPFRKSRMIQRRWQIGLPKTKEPHVEQNIAFWKIPSAASSGDGAERKLLCDVWQPPDGVERSGLALVYLHGSGWYILDKDMGTRPMFRQLVSQGHVVMDVSYRLMPEVDIYEMVGDVKRAVAWMKDNAGRYGVNPERIVLGGGSAGGHLALLAAYAPDDPQLTPPDLEGRDLTVRAVVSMYGPTDLRACYHHLDQKRLLGLPKVEIGQPGAATMEKKFWDAGRLDALLGGHLHEVPEVYALASPVVHAGAGSPPTLLIQGAPDVIAPVAATRALHQTLAKCRRPVVNIIYPLTNHGFDLILPEVSPPAQAALYDLEQFLALVI